jgi:hypothetical protein
MCGAISSKTTVTSSGFTPTVSSKALVIFFANTRLCSSVLVESHSMRTRGMIVLQFFYDSCTDLGG